MNGASVVSPLHLRSRPRPPRPPQPRHLRLRHGLQALQIPAPLLLHVLDILRQAAEHLCALLDGADGGDEGAPGAGGRVGLLAADPDDEVVVRLPPIAQLASSSKQTKNVPAAARQECFAQGGILDGVACLVHGLSRGPLDLLQQRGAAVPNSLLLQVFRLRVPARISRTSSEESR